MKILNNSIVGRLFAIRADVLFNVLEKVTAVLIKLATLYLLIRFSGSVAQGQYKYIIDTAMLFNIISLFGMDNYNIYLMTTSYKDKDRKSVNALVTHNILWVIFTYFPVLSLIYVSTQVFDLLEPIVPSFVLLISMIAFSMQSRYLIRNLWVGVGNIIYISVYQILSDLFLLFFIFYLALNDSIDIFNIFRFFILINFVFTCIVLIQLFIKIRYKPQLDWKLFLVQLKGGSKLFIYTIFFALMLRVDSLIIMKFLGPSFTGYYGIASQYSEFVYFIVIALSQIIVKETALNKDVFIKEWLKRVQIIQIALVVLLLSFTFLLPIILGDEYTNAIVPAIILLFGTYFWGLYIFFNYMLLGMNKLTYLLVTSVSGVIVNVILNLIFINWLGIVGAAIASSISYVFTLGFLVYLIRKEKLIDYSFYRSILPV